MIAPTQQGWTNKIVVMGKEIFLVTRLLLVQGKIGECKLMVHVAPSPGKQQIVSMGQNEANEAN